MSNNGPTQVSSVSQQTPRRKPTPVFIEKSYIPKKQKGGSISKTENRNLLALVLEKAKSASDMAQPTRRAYANSPPLSKDDDNDYQFVNPDIDDELDDDVQLEASRRKMFDNRGRGYAMPERDSLEESTDIDLRKEEEYQRQLHARIAQASEHEALKQKYDVPNLNLDESVDSLDDSPKDSIDDSLDIEGEDSQPQESYSDSLDWRNPPPNPFDSGNGNQQVFRKNNEPDWSNPNDDDDDDEVDDSLEDNDDRYEDMNQYDDDQQDSSRHDDSNVQQPDQNSYQKQVEYERRNDDIDDEPLRENYDNDAYRVKPKQNKIRQHPPQQQDDYDDQYSQNKYDSHDDSHHHRRQRQSGNREDSYQNPSARGPSNNYENFQQNQPPQNYQGPNYPNFNPQNAQYFVQGSQNFNQGLPFPQQMPVNYPQAPYGYQYPPQNFAPHPQQGYANYQQQPLSRGGYTPAQPPPQNFYGQPPGQFPPNQYVPVNQSMQYPPMYGSYQPPGPLYQQPLPYQQQQHLSDNRTEHQLEERGFRQVQPQPPEDPDLQFRKDQNSENYNDFGDDPPRGQQQPRAERVPNAIEKAKQQHQVENETPRSTRRSPFVEKPPRLNFVEFNKEVLAKGAPKKGYGDRFKERVENVASPLSDNGRLTRTIKKPPRPLGSKIPKAASADNIGRPAKAASAGDIGRMDKNDGGGAENLWTQRARRLSFHKQQAVASAGKKTSGRVRPLKKYASDSGINLQKQQARAAPHFVEPIPQKAGYSDIKTSKRVEVPVPAWNEDQQRVSVDINLKLISPQPPLGPIHKSKPSQNNDSLERQNRNNYYNQQWSQYVEPNDREIHGQRDLGYSSNYDASQEHGYGNYGNSSHGNQFKENGQGHEIEDQGYYDQENYEEDENNQPSFTSPRDNLSTSRDSPTVNPYHKIPPISDHQKGQSNGKETGGSYMQEYSKQKDRAGKKPNYKKYTMDDYRKLKLEISLGGLGPTLDEDTWKEKNEKRRRQLNYAKQVAIENRPAQGKVKPVRYPREEEKDDDIMNRRKVAIEYSKSVPKPKVVPKYGSHGGAALMRRGEDQEEAERLRQLQERHLRDRSEIADLRSNVGSVLSTAR